MWPVLSTVLEIFDDAVPVACSSENKSSGEGKGVPDTAYDPSKAKYHPVSDACWKHGEK